MVFRCLEYEMRNYSEQMDESCRSKRWAAKMPASIDATLDNDTVPTMCPIVSLVIYFGTDKVGRAQNLLGNAWTDG